MIRLDDWTLAQADKVAARLWDAFGVRARDAAIGLLGLWGVLNMVVSAPLQAWAFFAIFWSFAALRFTFTPTEAVCVGARHSPAGRLIRALAWLQIVFMLAQVCTGLSHPVTHAVASLSWWAFIMLDSSETPKRPRRRRAAKVAWSNAVSVAS